MAIIGMRQWSMSGPYVMGGGAPPRSLTATDTKQTLSTTTSYTITAAVLGATNAGRVTYVSVAWYDSSFGGATINAMTVGGIAAARVGRSQGDNNFNNCEVWAVVTGAGSAVENDTTANIVMTLSRDVRMTTAVYRGVGYSSSAGTVGTGVSSATATIAAGGMALAVACNLQNAAASISNVTEDYNFSVSAGGHRGVHGSKESAAGESLTSTFSSSTPNATRMVAVPFAGV